MRVGIDYRPAVLLRSGIGRYTANLVRHLPEVWPDVRLALFSVFWREHGAKLAAARLPRHDRVDVAAMRFPGRVLDFLGRWTPLAVETFADAFDVFHFTDFVKPPVRARAAVFTLHDLGFRRDEPWHEEASRERLREVTDRLVARCQVILAVSETTRRDVQEHYDLPDDRIIVTPLGVDEIFLEPYERAPQERPTIVAVGTLEPRKNFRRLLEAFEVLLERGREARLVLVGRRGWLCDDVLEKLAAPRLAEHARWVGEIGDESLLALMRNADVIAYPSLFEGFGLPVLEGMALGVPVLTSDRGSLREVAGDAAELVDPESVDSIAAGLERLLDDAARREDLARRGRERAAGFSWRRCAEATLEGYRRAISSCEAER